MILDLQDATYFKLQRWDNNGFKTEKVIWLPLMTVTRNISMTNKRGNLQSVKTWDVTQRRLSLWPALCNFETNSDRFLHVCIRKRVIRGEGRIGQGYHIVCLQCGLSQESDSGMLWVPSSNKHRFPWIPWYFREKVLIQITKRRLKYK